MRAINKRHFNNPLPFLRARSSSLRMLEEQSGREGRAYKLELDI